MKDLDKLLKLGTITRKDLMAEGFSDYEIKKMVLEGVIEKMVEVYIQVKVIKKIALLKI